MGFYRVIEYEGTITPTFTAATPPTGVTYTTQEGRWLREGSRVYYEFVMTLSNKGAGGVGTVNIGGLPFNSRAGTYGGQGGSCRVNFLTFPAGGFTGPMPRVLQSSKLIVISWNASAVAVVNSAWSEFANNTSISASGWYMVD